MKERPVNKRVLEYVNRIRIKHNCKPLKALPKGRPGGIRAVSGKHCGTKGCVIANALLAVVPSGGFVDVDGEQIAFGKNHEIPYDKYERIDVPQYIAKFIDRFDNGSYPQLELAEE